MLPELKNLSIYKIFQTYKDYSNKFYRIKR